MRWIPTSLVALLAVLALSASAATSASAFHPLFFTQSGKELLFSGTTNSSFILRSEEIGLAATVECSQALAHGFLLHLSTLAHRALITLHKCLQKIGGGANEVCNEPIVTKRLLVELGLLTSLIGRALLLVAPADGTSVFVPFICGGHKTTVKGSVIGEIPAINAVGENQINTVRNSVELVFATINKSNQQSITEIFLLGAQMVKQELTTEEFLGGSAGLEATLNLKGDGTIEISTTKV